MYLSSAAPQMGHQEIFQSKPASEHLFVEIIVLSFCRKINCYCERNFLLLDVSIVTEISYIQLVLPNNIVYCQMDFSITLRLQCGISIWTGHKGIITLVMCQRFHSECAIFYCSHYCSFHSPSVPFHSLILRQKMQEWWDLSFSSNRCCLS